MMLLEWLPISVRQSQRAQAPDCPATGCDSVSLAEQHALAKHAGGDLTGSAQVSRGVPQVLTSPLLCPKRKPFPGLYAVNKYGPIKFEIRQGRGENSTCGERGSAESSPPLFRARITQFPELSTIPSSPGTPEAPTNLPPPGTQAMHNQFHEHDRV